MIDVEILDADFDGIVIRMVTALDIIIAAANSGQF